MPQGARVLKPLAGLALALLLAACGDRARLDTLAQGPQGQVTAVATGDRLALADGTQVRLAGVEAPALSTPYGSPAREVLAKLAQGRTVELLYGGPRTRDGAALAQVRLAGGAWLQGALLDAGAVRVRPRAEDRALADLMLAHEARARAGERGLWGLAAYRVRLPRELAPWEAGLQVVEGRVRRVSDGRGRTFIDFADDWRDVASAEVASRTLRDFRDAGADVRGLQGKLVRVRGEVRRLRMTVEAPEAVEVLRER